MDEPKKLRSGQLNGSLMNGDQHRNSIRSEELRHLENKIRQAYVTKTLRVQLAEREADNLAANIQSRISEEITQLKADVEHVERTRLEREEQTRRVGELKLVLERQVGEKREERYRLEQEERSERRVLMEVDKVRDEVEARDKLQRREELIEQLCLEGLIQSEIREIDQRRLEEYEIKEAAKNRRYLEELEQRAERTHRVRVEAVAKREVAIASVARVLLEMQREKRARQRLLLDLMVEEVKFEAEIEAREAEARRREKMREVAGVLEEQMSFEETCKRRFLEREKKFAEDVMAKVMESEAMERLTADVRRRKRTEYRQELEKLMRERERVRAEELSRLRVALEEERLKKEADREEARKARMLLLEQHVEHIGDFMTGKSLYAEERRIVEDSRKSHILKK